MLSFLELLQQHGSTSTLLLPLIFFTIIAFSFTIILINKWFPLSSKSISKSPPSPPRFPIIGNLHQLGFHPHRSLKSLAQVHGPVMLLHFGSAPVVVISSADMAQEIMKSYDPIFASRPNLAAFKILAYDRKDVATAPYGEHWRQVKSICVLHLLSSKRVKSFQDVRVEETASTIEKIKNSSSSALNLSELFARLTNDIVCRVAVGRTFGGTCQGRRTFQEIFTDYSELLAAFDVGEYIPWLAWISHVNGLRAKMRKVAKEFDDFLNTVVEEHIDAKGNIRSSEDTSAKDFMDVLLWIQEKNLAGSQFDRTSVKAIILDVFAAGTDTTYTTLEWIMTELLKHPETMKKLQCELREVGQNNSFITETELNDMQYLKAVIKETLRLHPPLPLLLPRVASEDVTLKGFNIKAGTQVIINAFAIGRDYASWDQAEKFMPERFLNSSIDFKGHDFSLIPFGSGRRSCPGIHFAISTIELVLANILHKFDWSLHGVDERVEGDLDIVPETTGTSVHRKFPLFAIATPYSY